MPETPPGTDGQAVSGNGSGRSLRVCVSGSIPSGQRRIHDPVRSPGRGVERGCRKAPGILTVAGLWSRFFLHFPFPRPRKAAYMDLTGICHHSRAVGYMRLHGARAFLVAGRCQGITEAHVHIVYRVYQYIYIIPRHRLQSVRRLHRLSEHAGTMGKAGKNGVAGRIFHFFHCIIPAGPETDRLRAGNVRDYHEAGTLSGDDPRLRAGI